MYFTNYIQCRFCLFLQLKQILSFYKCIKCDAKIGLKRPDYINN